MVMAKYNKDEGLIRQLQSNIPEINQLFDVHKKIGSGTFSSVFLATLKGDKQKQKKKYFAIKHLIPTTHPNRIEKELSCLMKIGGAQNVVGVDICFRHEYSVAFVMPYIPHNKFHEYFDKLTPEETQLYIRNLLIALCHVHSFSVIHRDVKPSNFLYNRSTKTFLLVDFGLAQDLNALKKRVEPKTVEADAQKPENVMKRKRKLDEDATASTTNDAKRKCLQPAENIENKEASPSKCNPIVFKTPLKQSNQTMNSPYNTPPLAQNIKSTLLGISVNLKMTTPFQEKRNASTTRIDSGSNSSDVLCFCYGKSQVCNICICKKEVQASRAGTPGYRSVEVLLKYAEQDCSVDIWSVGVIFLSLLSKCYPFFKSHDDYDALGEIITLFGDSKLKKTALLLGRHLKVGRKKQPLCIRKLCQTLRKRGTKTVAKKQNKNLATCDNCQQGITECICLKNSSHLESNGDLDEYSNQTYDLLLKLLEVNPKQRITASAALEHAYFSETY